MFSFSKSGQSMNQIKLGTKLGVFLLLAASVAACGKNPGAEVIATIGDVKLSKSQFEAFLAIKGIPVTDPERYKAALQEYAKREAISQAIVESGVVSADTMEMELAEFKRQMLLSRYFETFMRDRVSEDEVKNYYSSHPELYQRSQAHVAHILIRTNPKTTDAEREAILTKMQDIYSRVTSTTDFQEAAREFSEDKNSSGNGGDLGWIDSGAIDPVFSQKAFSMAVGEVSPPFSTPFGYHIVKIIEPVRTVKKTLEQVEGQIRYQLRQETKTAELERLQKSVDISIAESARDKK